MGDNARAVHLDIMPKSDGLSATRTKTGSTIPSMPSIAPIKTDLDIDIPIFEDEDMICEDPLHLMLNNERTKSHEYRDRLGHMIGGLKLEDESPAHQTNQVNKEMHELRPTLVSHAFDLPPIQTGDDEEEADTMYVNYERNDDDDDEDYSSEESVFEEINQKRKNKALDLLGLTPVKDKAKMPKLFNLNVLRSESAEPSGASAGSAVLEGGNEDADEEEDENRKYEVPLPMQLKIVGAAKSDENVKIDRRRQERVRSLSQSELPGMGKIKQSGFDFGKEEVLKQNPELSKFANEITQKLKLMELRAEHNPTAVRRLKYQKKLEEAKRSPSTPPQAGDTDFTVDLRSLSEPNSPKQISQFEFEEMTKTQGLRLSLPYQPRTNTLRKMKLENTMSCPAGNGNSPDQYLPTTPRTLTHMMRSQSDPEDANVHSPSLAGVEEKANNEEHSAKDNHEKFGHVLNMLVAQGVYSRSTVNSMQQIRNLHMVRKQAISSPGSPTARMKNKILRMIQE